MGRVSRPLLCVIAAAISVIELNRSSRSLASVLVNYCVAVQPGQLVAIHGLPVAQPLLNETYREVLRAGGYPYLFASLDGVEELFLSEASDDQLQHVSKLSEMIAEGGGNISNLDILDRSPEFYEMTVDIEVHHVKQLSEIMVAALELDVIEKIERIRG